MAEAGEVHHWARGPVEVRGAEVGVVGVEDVEEEGQGARAPLEEGVGLVGMCFEGVDVRGEFRGEVARAPPYSQPPTAVSIPPTLPARRPPPRDGKPALAIPASYAA